MLKQLSLLFLGLFLISFTSAFTDNGSAYQQVTDCGNLSTANALYEIMNDINANSIANCFNINANNITLNVSSYIVYANSGTTNRYLLWIQNVNGFTAVSNKNSKTAGQFRTNLNTGLATTQRPIQLTNANNTIFDGVYGVCYETSGTYQSCDGMYYSSGYNTTIKNIDGYFYNPKSFITLSNLRGINVSNVTMTPYSGRTDATGAFTTLGTNVNGDFYLDNINFTTLGATGINTGFTNKCSYTNIYIKTGTNTATSYALGINRNSTNCIIENITIEGFQGFRIADTYTISTATPTFNITAKNIFVNVTNRALRFDGVNDSIIQNATFISNGNIACQFTKTTNTRNILNNVTCLANNPTYNDVEIGTATTNSGNLTLFKNSFFNNISFMNAGGARISVENNYGKVNFSSEITGVSHNFTNDVLIQDNNISINNAMFNKSSILSLYNNMGTTIGLNGVTCNGDCTLIYQDSTQTVFSITEWKGWYSLISGGVSYCWSQIETNVYYIPITGCADVNSIIDLSKILKEIFG